MMCHDGADEDQAHQQVERPAEPGGDLGGVVFLEVGQPRPEADADPRQAEAEDRDHPHVEHDHRRAHPEHQVAEDDQELGGDQRDPRRERELAPEDRLSLERAAGPGPRNSDPPARAAGR